MSPSVVPRASLERANGWLFGGTMLMQGMIAGPLAGFLFVVAASIPFFVNAGTYAASAVLIGLVGGAYRPSPRTGASADASADASMDASRDASAHGRADANAGDGEPRRSVRADIVEGFRWLAHQRVLRTMATLIGLLNLTLTAATAVLVLLAKERLHLGSVGYGLLFTCMAVGGILGSLVGDQLIKWISATWTIRIGLLIEAGMHLALATSRNAYFIGFALFAFGVHGTLWGIVGSSLRQRLTPPDLLGRVGSTSLFIAAGGNCVGAVLGGAIAAKFGLTAPYWVGFVVAIIVSAVTWRVFDRATVALAYAEPVHHMPSEPVNVSTNLD
jgi:Na+/melibiose symporter-like transporter